MQPESKTTINANSRIFVAGADTLIGEALVRLLTQQGYQNLLHGPRYPQPELTDAAAVDAFFAAHRPEFVFLAAGKSAGIRGNQRYPADLILNNLLVLTHTIDAAHCHRVSKLLYLASSCTYPKMAPQPMRVESLLTGPFEATNEAYATAKLAGIKLCQAYRAQHGANFVVAIPANGFGRADHFDPEDSHVIPGMLRKMHDAKVDRSSFVELWGTGQARREFLFADDLADAAIFVMQHYDGEAPINLGGGTDLSIAELAQLIKQVVGYRGELVFDISKPDGMPLKALEASALADLGWRPKTSFRDALAKTYQWFVQHESHENVSYARATV